MVARTTQADLRNAIKEIYEEVMIEHENGEAPNEVVLRKLKADKAADVAALTEYLVDRALIKILNEVSSRVRSNTNFPEEPDLFGEYRQLPTIVSVSRGSRKDLSNLTFLEADSWLKKHSRKVESDRLDEFRRLVDECRPFKTSDNDSLKVAFERKRLAQKSSQEQ